MAGIKCKRVCKSKHKVLQRKLGEDGWEMQNASSTSVENRDCFYFSICCNSS